MKEKTREGEGKRKTMEANYREDIQREEKSNDNRKGGRSEFRYGVDTKTWNRIAGRI